MLHDCADMRSLIPQRLSRYGQLNDQKLSVMENVQTAIASPNLSSALSEHVQTLTSKV